MTTSSSPAPGWYPDPKMVGTQRYWDGERWTDNAAPLTAPPARSAETQAFVLEPFGWIGAILLPPAGLVIGIIIAAKGGARATRGAAMILVSLLVMGLGYLWFSAEAERDRQEQIDQLYNQYGQP